MDFIVKKRQGSDEVLENPAKRLRNADTTDFTSEGGIATGHNNAVVDVLDSARFGVDLQGAGEKDIICHGEGLSLNGVKRGVGVQFIVDTLSAGEGMLNVVSVDNKGTRTKLNCILQGNGKYICNYTPNSDSLKIFVQYDGKSAYGSPYNVRIHPNFDPQKVVLTGLESGNIKVGTPAFFSVNTKEAGTADLSVSVKAPGSKIKMLDVIEDGEIDHKVFFNPSITGPHKIWVKFGGKNIPTSPFTINVLGEDADKIRVSDGDDKASELGFQRSIYIDPSGVQQGRLTYDVKGIRDVNNTFNMKAGLVGNLETRFVLICNYKDPIMHVITIKLNNHPISNGHFFQMASRSGNETQLSTFEHNRAYGPGLDKGVVGQPCLFKVTCKDLGDIDVNVTSLQSTPKIAKGVDRDGAHIVSYLPVTPGEYSVTITKAGALFPGSPFLVKIRCQDEKSSPVAISRAPASSLPAPTTSQNTSAVMPPVPFSHSIMTSATDSAKVLVSGLNLNGGKIMMPYGLRVDTSQARMQTEGTSMLTVGMSGPEDGGCRVTCEAYDKNTSYITYRVRKPGVYSLSILWGGRDINGSPFSINIV